MTRPPINALTGMRALAALGVYLHHFAPPALVPAALAKEGYVGVSVFFVLSGFVITYTYAADTELRAGWLWHYWRRRVARIYPVFLLVTLWTIWATHYRDPLGLLLNLTLTKGWSDAYKFSLIAPAWTLTVEETFYLLAPVLFIAYRRRWWALLVLAGGGPLAYALWWPSRFVCVYTYVGRSFEFLIGIALAAALPWLRARWRALPVAVLTYVGVALFAGVLLALSRAGGDGFGIFSQSGFYWHHYALPVATTVLFAGLALEGSVLAWLLGSPVGVLLGRASYVFYLIHVGVVRDWLGPQVGGGYWRMLGALTAVAVAAHLLVEEPLRRLLAPRRAAGAAS